MENPPLAAPMLRTVIWSFWSIRPSSSFDAATRSPPTVSP